MEASGKMTGNAVMEYGRFMSLIQRLLVDHSTRFADLEADSSRSERTSTVVISPHLNHMLHAYAFSGLGTGVTWVMYAPTDSGKTAAADYLLHGEH